MAGLIFRTKLAALFSPPPVPVTFNVNDPVGASEGSVTVSAEAKLRVPDGVVKTPLAPEGNPETDRVTSELKPFKLTTFIWYVVVPP